MKLLGQQEAATFLRDRSEQAETLRARFADMRHGRSDSPEVLLADFHNRNATSPPGVVFRLDTSRCKIETFVDFRTGSTS
jgi:hypothetical protein